MSTSRPVGDGLPESGVRGLLGELELLALQLPAVVQPEDPDRAEIIAPAGGHQVVDHRDHHRVGRSEVSCAD